MVWLWENLELVLGLAADHARLSVIPILVSLIAAVPLGWLATLHPAVRSFILFVSGAAFTIPSLALFIVLPAVLGTKILDEANVVVALSIYGVAVMARGAADAFASVPKDVVNSSTAVGYSRVGRFWTVELPLAGPVILASLRVVAVSTISMLTVGSLIGVQSLGYLFLNGSSAPSRPRLSSASSRSCCSRSSSTRCSCSSADCCCRGPACSPAPTAVAWPVSRAR